jgi:peptidoglycan/xylan/chitin deacetylase (PgdA/CDA1 family)
MDNFAITLDIDWAPDHVIEDVAASLIKNGVKATWFVTHQSEAVSRMMREHADIFEFGLHPNFLPGSSHGATQQEIFETAKSLVPGAAIMRTHALVQSTPLLYMAANNGVNVDVTLFLRESANIEPHTLYIYDKEILRIPYFWEDDLDSYFPGRTWNFADSRYHVPGLKIFNFHPMYIYLNSDTMQGYEQLKKIKYLPELSKEEIAPFINKGKGVRTLFEDMIQHLKRDNSSLTISEIAGQWTKSKKEQPASLLA